MKRGAQPAAGLPHRANSSPASAVVEEGHEGKRRTESLWPVHQINWQRSRYIYDLYYKYGKISRELYDYCLQEVRSRRPDAPLPAPTAAA